MKKVKLFVAIGCISAVLAMPMTSFAGQWKQDSKGWWWQEDNGTYPTSTWKEIGGKQYYFGPDGYMFHDTTTPDGKHVGSDGAFSPLFDYDIDNCHITYVKHERGKDYEGNDCVIIYYNYTNKKSDECSAIGNSAYISLYQNGVQCDHATISSLDNNAAAENYYKSVLPGTTIEVAEAFKINGTENIEVTIKDLFDFLGTSPKLRFSLGL